MNELIKVVKEPSHLIRQSANSKVFKISLLEDVYIILALARGFTREKFINPERDVNSPFPFPLHIPTFLPTFKKIC